MAALDRIRAARQAYLRELKTYCDERRRQYETHAAEVPLRLHGETTLLDNLFLLDVIGRIDAQEKIGDCGGADVAIDDAIERPDGKRIVIERFGWSRALLRTVGAPLPIDAIRAWFERWRGPVPETAPGSVFEIGVRLDDEIGTRLDYDACDGPTDDDEFRGVVHGVAVAGAHEIFVDFGSAPLDAFVELLEVLARTPACLIEIDSHPAYEGPFYEALRLLQHRQAREVEAARDDTAMATGTGPAAASEDDPIEEFFEWFEERRASLAGLMEAARKSSPKRQGDLTAQRPSILERVHQEVYPRLAEIDADLDFEIGAGLEKRYAFTVSGGGAAELIPVVQTVVAQAPDLPEWEFVAFKRPRPLNSAVTVNHMETGHRLDLDPRDIRVSLRPRLNKVDVTLYFKDIDAVAKVMLHETGDGILELVLGEYDFMQGVGELTIESDPDERTETFPLAELKQRFDAEAGEVRRVLAGMRAAPADERMAYVCFTLEDEIARFERLLAGFGAFEEIEIGFVFWCATADQVERIEAALPDFELWSGAGISLAGDGGGIVAEGPCPVPGGEFRAWLNRTLAPILEAGAFLTGLEEPESYPADVADMRASQFMREERWAEAAKLLRPVADRFGEVEDGRLHAKAGLCYSESGHPECAIPYFERALELLQDDTVRGETLTNLGVALQLTGRVGDALPYYEQALDLDPDSALRRYNLGQAYAILDDPERACRHLHAAIQLDRGRLPQLFEDESLAPIRDTDAFRSLARELAI